MQAGGAPPVAGDCYSGPGSNVGRTRMDEARSPRGVIVAGGVAFLLKATIEQPRPAY